MPFSTTGSVISTDLDNMLRGLFRDNSDHAVTGTVAETTMASFTVPANTIGPTGALHIMFSGSLTGAAGIKTIKAYFGATSFTNLVCLAADIYWTGDVWIYNTSTTTQRMAYRISSAPAGGIVSTHVIASFPLTEDTTVNKLIKVTTTNASVADTATQQTFDVFVVQIN